MEIEIVLDIIDFKIEEYVDRHAYNITTSYDFYNKLKESYYQKYFDVTHRRIPGGSLSLEIILTDYGIEYFAMKKL